MATRVATKGNGAGKLISKIGRTTSLDWREFDFFKAGVGLSRHDQLSIRVCLDYELAREWRLLVECLKNCSEKQKQEVLSMPESRRDAAIPFESPFDPADMHPVPTVCIAASWFPAPWLSGPAGNREKIVKNLTEFYSGSSWRRGLSVSDFPMDDRLVERLIKRAKEQSRTLHVLTINRAQTRSVWLRIQDLG
jgi:hypothetical protein